eukprot:7376679-Prymnesium_polylepis.1
MKCLFLTLNDELRKAHTTHVATYTKGRKAHAHVATDSPHMRMPTPRDRSTSIDSCRPHSLLPVPLPQLAHPAPHHLHILRQPSIEAVAFGAGHPPRERRALRTLDARWLHVDATRRRHTKPQARHAARRTRRRPRERASCRRRARLGKGDPPRAHLALQRLLLAPHRLRVCRGVHPAKDERDLRIVRRPRRGHVALRR